LRQTRDHYQRAFFGAFARLDAGVEGLIHASEIPMDEGKSLKEIFLKVKLCKCVFSIWTPRTNAWELSMRLQEA